MNNLLKKLKENKDFTRPNLKKQKKFNKIKNNIPLLEDYNMMADLIELPTTKEGYKYLLSVVDLASDEFDIEPLKTKTPDEVLTGFKKMIKRKHIGKPYASIRTDNGKEFKGEFDKYLSKEGILHKLNLPNRHKQMANVEALNKQLGLLINTFMNNKEEETKKRFREWTKIVDFVRTELNKIRKKTLKKKFDFNDYPDIPYDEIGNPKFKVGDIVYEKLETPEDALGHKQNTNNFRVGDYKISRVPKKIKNVLLMNDEPYFRYILEGMPNVSYSEYELIKSKEKETKYIVKDIIGKKKIKGKTHYLIWWKGMKKEQATYEPEKNLIEDGFKNIINEFNKNDK